jgi:predicted transcriptional regulator
VTVQLAPREQTPEELSGDGLIHIRRVDLDGVCGAFERELYLPDKRPLLAVLAATVANRMDEGDPVWLTVIGGSSRGKTEIVTPLGTLPEVHVTGKLTEASLLSGTSRKERAQNAKGGLLREIGDRGTLVIKDLGALLTLHRDSRSEVLQALRDVYDGLYTRDVGSDGGQRLRWDGKLGLIAAGTTAVDSAHAVVSALGERWLTIRLPAGDDDEIARSALLHGDTAEMREKLRTAVSGFVEHISPPRLVPLDPHDENLLVALSSLTCRARSPVDRDPYASREIILVHDSEGPARLVQQLHKLHCALSAMGMARADVRDLLIKIGYDSIPSPRREVLLAVLAANGPMRTATIASDIDIPTRSAERALEELTAHRLLAREKAGEHGTAANLWSPTDLARQHYQAISALPDLSEREGSSNTDTALKDISGEALAAAGAGSSKGWVA